LFALNLPRRLARAADALSGTVNTICFFFSKMTKKDTKAAAGYNKFFKLCGMTSLQLGYKAKPISQLITHIQHVATSLTTPATLIHFSVRAATWLLQTNMGK
jgi:hypothetical protein